MHYFGKYPALFLFLFILSINAVFSHFTLFSHTLFSLGTLQDEGFIYASGDHFYFYGSKGKYKLPSRITWRKDVILHPVKLNGNLREIRPPSGYGQFNYVKYLFSQDISGVLSSHGLIIQVDSSISLPIKHKVYNAILKASYPAHLKWSGILESRLRMESSNHYFSIFSALFLGKKNEIDEHLKNNFRETGLFHVLAISGFHVALISGMLLFIFRFIRIPFKASGPIVLLLLAFYVPVCGASESVIRAVIMSSCFICGKLFFKKASSLNSLGIAGGILLLINPASWLSPGFQLSFAASFSILYYLPVSARITQNLKVKIQESTFLLRLKSPGLAGQIICIATLMVSPLLVTFSAVLGTFPFISEGFQLLPLSSFPGTLTTVPLISLSMLAASLGTLQDMLCQWQRNYFFEAANLFLDLSIFSTQILSKAEFLQISQAHKPLGFWITYSLLFLLIPQVVLKPKKKIFKVSSQSTAIAISFAMLICLYFSEVKKAFSPLPEIHFIDVDQGDATLIRTASGHNILIDAANKTKWRDFGEQVILPHLRYHGISKLDMVLLTHADADHYLGVGSLLNEIQIESFVIPEVQNPSTKPAWNVILQEVEKRNIPIFNLGAGDHLQLGPKEQIEVLWPSLTSTSTGTNENSLCLHYQFQSQYQLIISGDLFKKQEKEILKAQLLEKNLDFAETLLKTGHHGSKTSTSKEWLEYWKPDAAFISAGYKSRFKHPHQETLQQLKAQSIPYYRSDAQGTVTSQMGKGYRTFLSRFDSSASTKLRARFK